MTANLTELGLRLDDVIRAVPGVTAVFSTPTGLVRSVRSITARIPLALVAVSQTTLADGGDRLSIAASIGVSSEHQAPTTALAVSNAIRAALPPETAEAASVQVRISRISN